MVSRKLFFITFVLVHVLFIFLQVTRHIQFIHESYQKQKHERLYMALCKERDTLHRNLERLQNKEVIAEYARSSLGLKAMNLKQIKRLTHDGVENN